MEWNAAIWLFVQQSWHARRARSLLLAAAIASTAALVAAVASAIATAQINIEGRLQRSLGESDARIVHENGAHIPATLVAQARALPQVKAAAGRLHGAFTVTRADGRTGTDGRPRRTTVNGRGVDLDCDAVFRQIDLSAGVAPQAEDEIALNELAARDLDAHPGDTLLVQRLGDPISLRVSGIIESPSLGALQRPGARLSRVTLSNITRQADRVTLVSIVLNDEVDPAAWVAAHAAEFPAPLKLEPSEAATTGIERATTASQMVLRMATVIAFLGAAFIVGTGLLTALTQQQREIAILRALGASRLQVFCGQMANGALLGLIGSVVGIPLGIGLARALAWWWADALPEGFATSSEAVALGAIAGVGAAIVGAIIPAHLATRVLPVEALAVRARVPRPWALALGGGIALLLIGGSTTPFLINDVQQRFWVYLQGGVPAMLVGWFLASAVVFALLSRLIAPPLARLLQLPRGLLEGSVRAHPWRLGLTGGALMIGMASLVEGRTNGPALMNDLAARLKFADAFVFRTSGISAPEQAAIAGINQVASAVSIAYLPLRVGGSGNLGIAGITSPNVVCIGFQPEPFFALNRIDWIQGDPQSALPALRQGNSVLVAKEFLAARSVRVGDTLQLGTARQMLPFTIVGVVGAAGLDVATQYFGIHSVYMEHAVSCVFMDLDALEKHFGTREATIMQLQLHPGATVQDEERVQEQVERFAPGTQFASGRGIRQGILSAGETALFVASGAATLAMALTALAVGNVVAAGVAARRHEFGVLQACGAGPGVVVRLVLAEAGLIALTASIVGTGMGLQLAALGRVLLHDLGGIDVSAGPPWLAIFWGTVALLACSLGAAAPSVIGLIRQSPRALLATARGE